jgi:hypothetical protein
MRGFPPLQLLCLALLFGLLAVPLVRLTSGTPATQAAAHSSGESSAQGVVAGSDHHPAEAHVHKVRTRFRLRFAHAPAQLSLRQEGRELVPKPNATTASPLEFEAELEIDHAGNELLLSAAWPEGTPETALTVELEPEGLETRDATRWSKSAKLEEVLLFQW